VEATPRRVEVYLDPDNRAPFDSWLSSLNDSRGKGQIEARIIRLRRGLLGSYRDLGEGVLELKVDTGPGYRIYCADDGESTLILFGGTKRTQRADIKKRRRIGESTGANECQRDPSRTRWD
jgi:putative addiction module killer protein